MLTLAIDTTGSAISLAILENEYTKIDFMIDTKVYHNENAAPLILNALSALKLTMEDIDLLACSFGPGSFTGLRVSLSLIKGLSFFSELPCIGVSTLESLSYACYDFLINKSTIVCTVLEANENEIYYTCFKNKERICDDNIIKKCDFFEAVLKYKNSSCKDEFFFCLGDIERISFLYYNNYVGFHKNFYFQKLSPNACFVGKIAFNKYKKFKCENINFESKDFSGNNLVANYLKLSKAERDFLETLSKNQ